MPDVSTRDPSARVPLSVLDLVPVRTGSSAGEALAETLALARHVERLGYRRYWFAEHHGMEGIASAAPAVLVGQVAAATTTMRVGSGGVMLPNHAPLVIAEQFGTLEALFPGRIDLGLGRAPGSDVLTSRALGRPATAGEDFPEQLVELFGFFRGQFAADHPFHKLRAMPAMGNEPRVWLLGSSGYSAQLAGLLGLPFSFAHHFSAGNTLPALALYRERFRPSPALQRPEAMVAAIALVADSDEEARRLALPMALAFLRARTGRTSTYPTVAEAEAHPWSESEREFVQAWMRTALVGSPASVRAQLDRLVDVTGADELMVLCTAPDADARLRSYTLLRELHDARR
jgi:luciferase family oxidoreductase group 1